MDVSCGMALAAGSFLFLVARRPLMAGLTTKIPMFASKREFRRLVMNELILVPAFGRVTCMALFAIAAMMFVVGAVTVITVRGQLILEIGVMAALTRCCRVPSQEPVLGIAIMIEGRAFPPLC